MGSSHAGNRLSGATRPEKNKAAVTMSWLVPRVSINQNADKLTRNFNANPTTIARSRDTQNKSAAPSDCGACDAVGHRADDEDRHAAGDDLERGPAQSAASHHAWKSTGR